MSYEVVVPEGIQQEIASLKLHPDLEEQVYQRLGDDLEHGHEHTLFRLPAPCPTYVYALALMDPAVPLRRHLFTFYLTDGEREQTLVVQQVEHRFRDNWWSDPDDGGPGSPEDDD